MENAKDAVRRTHTIYRPWRSYCAVLLLSLITAAAGCRAVSYKTGGTAGDYQAARARCQKEGRAESPDFERCMQDHGWIAKQFGAPAAPSDAKKNLSPVSLSESPQSAPAAGEAKKSVTAESPPPTSQPTPVTSDSAPSPQLNDAPSRQERIVVKNWFKLGGTAVELAAAKQRCATKLGTADRPEPESETVTREMLDCLRNEGWQAF